MLLEFSLQSVRNLSQFSWIPQPGANLLIGKNGIGKTTVLESLFLLSDNRVLRSQSTHEFVKAGDTFAKLWAKIDHSRVEVRLLPSETSPGRYLRRYFENGVQKPYLKRQVPFYTVLFLPEEVRLFHGAPSRRREFLDTLLTKLDVGYARSLKDYEKALKQRNALLADAIETGHINLSLLDILTHSLAESGVAVWSARRKWWSALMPLFEESLAQFWRGKRLPELKYQPSGSVLFEEKNQYLKQLALLTNRERRLGRTLIGPHLDDFEPYIESRPLRDTASRGELRSLSLSLKFAEVNQIQALTSIKPLLLLDDVMSELDVAHRKAVENFSLDYQCIYTATETLWFSSEFVKEALVYEFDLSKLANEATA